MDVPVELPHRLVFAPRGAGIVTLLAVTLVLSNAALRADEDSREQRLPSDEFFHETLLPAVEKYCVKCHDDDDPKGDVSLEGLARPEQILENRDIWERTFKQLGVGGMPPVNKKRRPSREQEAAIIEWLDLKLYHCDCSKVDDVGRETIQRLNRVEYTNTIRDLLGVETSVADDFPSDDVGYGFANIGDVLSLPPLLLEKYVDASEKIAAQAVLTTPLGKRKKRYGSGELKVTGGGREGSDGWYTLYSSGAVSDEHVVDRAGEHILRVEAMADQAGPELAKVAIEVDGKRVKAFEVKGRRKSGTYEVRQRLAKGKHRIAAAFINDYYDARDKADRNLFVRAIEVQGPIDVEAPKSHRGIVFTRPADDKSVAQAAREVVGRLLPRAFRRPVSEDEVARYAGLVELVTTDGESFERGVQIALQAILVSPHFLFRVEYDDEPNDPKAQHALTDHELASRLSYFLWSTMPDDELFELAERGKLHERDVLDRQVTRMLADPRADAIVENFASQWLELSNLDEITPDAKLFPEFTPELRADMVRETQLFIRALFREDRSLLDFIDADYSFVNERLAKHYGIDGVRGDKMRRVPLPPTQRTGVLTHASILTITSNPNRTSLVRRGNWLINNVMGLQLPEPPEVQQTLEEGAKESGLTSMRDQLKLHREDPGCASCHNTMDPLGFGMENFDAIGRWREIAEGRPVDSGGTLPSGETFRGPVELAQILKKRKRDFAELVTKKMLTYALGRGLEVPDSCTVDDIVADLEANDYRFTVLVRGIVQSRPFRMRRGDDAGAR